MIIYHIEDQRHKMKKEEPKKEYAYLPSNPPQRANVYEKKEQPKPDIKKKLSILQNTHKKNLLKKMRKTQKILHQGLLSLSLHNKRVHISQKSQQKNPKLLKKRRKTGNKSI